MREDEHCSMPVRTVNRHVWFDRWAISAASTWLSEAVSRHSPNAPCGLGSVLHPHHPRLHQLVWRAPGDLKSSLLVLNKPKVTTYPLGRLPETDTRLAVNSKPSFWRKVPRRDAGSMGKLLCADVRTCRLGDCKPGSCCDRCLGAHLSRPWSRISRCCWCLEARQS